MRFFVDIPLADHAELALPPGAARHAQVRRVQPGSAIVVFDGSGRDWPAEVLRIGRSEVTVRLGAGLAVARELRQRVTLALGMPANERMDTLVEKAAELGVAAVQPLVCERSVLRVAGERAAAKRAHWQAVAQAACEQCGRARVPSVAAVQPFAAWLAAQTMQTAQAQEQAQAQTQAGSHLALVLSLQADARPLATLPLQGLEIVALSGPEGGLAPAEEAAARAAGFLPVALGPRVLRADTAPLALLAWVALQGDAAA